MSKIGFIGGGNMAEALIKGIIEAGIYKADQVFVSDIMGGRLDFLAKEYGVSVFGSNNEVAKRVDTLVLSVKPQKFDEACQSIASAVTKKVLVVSIAAGICVDKIGELLGDRAIIRVMPNTPALIGQGASALFANDKGKARLDDALKIFSSVGKAVVVEKEQLIDAVTAVSGSGPAYYFLLMEEMIKAGTELGLGEDICRDLVLQTAKGAAMLAEQAAKQGQSCEQLRHKVTSPGGTTEAALKVFTEGKFGKLVTKAITHARDKSIELGG